MSLETIRGATVNRLRVRCDRADPIGCRSRAGWALDESALRPAGLSPASILCIRRIEDPLPRRVRLQGAVRPPADWTNAVAERVATLVRHAHAADGNVPPDAEAVLFADRAQLLACLAQDWCAGTLAQRWWWQALLRGTLDVRRVLAAWRGSPEHIAGALAVLTARTAVVPFLTRLDDCEVRALLLVATQAHALHAITAGVALFTGAAGEIRPTHVATSCAHTDASAARQHGEAVDARGPWAVCAPEADTLLLSTIRQLLLGIALSAHRAPHVVSSRAFAEQVAAWIDSRAEGVRDDARVVHERADAGASALLPADTSPGDACDPVEGIGAVGDRAAAAVGGLPVAERKPGGVGSEDSKDRVSVADAARARLTPAVVDTGFGGVLCLLNVGIYLGLYGDFTTPLRPGIPLPIWDFIALLGRAMVGRRLCRDPLWPLCAELSGRDVRAKPGYHVARGREVDLGALLETAEAHLTLALGTRTRRRAGRLLCARPARIHLTATHLDAVFKLHALPIEVRVSGLDRNPGWIPAAGRVVAFHYE